MTDTDHDALTWVVWHQGRGEHAVLVCFGRRDTVYRLGRLWSLLYSRVLFMVVVGSIPGRPFFWGPTRSAGLASGRRWP